MRAAAAGKRRRSASAMIPSDPEESVMVSSSLEPSASSTATETV
ncbi:hypothetical protein [uncultured Bifidobacterium sp.]|nr:hypothetical protein [uncultured Bifidobacterium sp.]